MSKIEFNNDECGMIAEILDDKIKYDVDSMIEFFQYQENEKLEEQMKQTKQKMINIRDRIYQVCCTGA